MFNAKKELKYTVDQALYQIGYGPFQQSQAMLSCAGIGSYQIISFIINLPEFKKTIELNNNNVIWINPIIGLFVAQMCGGVYWTYIGNKYGRKRASLYSVLLNLINHIGFFFIPLSTLWINIYALILGFSIGTNISTDIQMFNDFTLYQKIKSQHLICILYWKLISIAASFLISLFSVSMMEFKVGNIINTVLVLSVLLSRARWQHESPRYLVKEHRVYSAADTLYLLAEKNKSELPLGSLDMYSKETTINKYEANPLECFKPSELKNNSIFIAMTYSFSYTMFTILNNIDSLAEQYKESFTISLLAIFSIVMVITVIAIFTISPSVILPYNKNIMIVTSFLMTVMILLFGISDNGLIGSLSLIIMTVSFFISALCLIIQAINNTSSKYKLSILSMIGYCLIFSGLSSTIMNELLGNYFEADYRLHFLFCSFLTGVANLLTFKTRNFNEITRIISLNDYEEFVPDEKDKIYYTTNKRSSYTLKINL
ncbi:MFS general substrate transporter [Neocallimastix lanati (nom. inval.)]|uniref:MFS general substrate transporter n=1 Tax=Neocallimastix californiae TaxID=1754190 RepID=A0A1Y2EQ88_9FUNG|nr:MFS general substrate transporter [Neocallimastix sp. JGI-2020a]ORY73751.1 MFS general substrate transporter [Neocallimastix californiae]|eukprot:ORY73751.1 MFS general substrate transporter [Neocallimastix californiae]